MTDFPDRRTTNLPMELLHEVRDKVDKMNDNFLEFKNAVVTKEELKMWQDTKRNTTRWAVGTIIAVAMLLVAFATIIIQTRPDLLGG